MKKILVLVMSAMLAVSLLFTGCSLQSDDREEELATILEDTYTTLSETFSGSGSKFAMVEDYLKSWANSNDIKVYATSDHYILLKNKATSKKYKGLSTMFQCSVDTTDMEKANHLMAVSLTSLLGPEDHGAIWLLVTESDADGFHGVSSIDPKHLNVKNLINLNINSETTLKTSGAYAFDATLYRGVKYKKPSYDTAYEITMTIGDYKDAFDFTQKYPNPINVLGDYLASCQSSGHLFQLAKLSSKSSECYTPTSASTTVVIDANNVEKMKKKFDKSYERVKKQCEKLGIDFVYTMTETSMPSRVVTDTYTNRIASLLYTIDPGIVTQDEETGEILAAEDFVSVDLNDRKLVLKLNARAVTKSALSDAKQTLITTVGLSDIKHNISDTYITWSSKKALADYFIETLEIKEDAELTTLQTSDLNILTNKNPKLNCISYGYKTEDDSTAMLNCIHFLTSLTEKD